MASLPPITEEERANVKASNYEMSDPALKNREMSIARSQQDVENYEALPLTEKGRRQIQLEQEAAARNAKYEVSAAKVIRDTNKPVAHKVVINPEVFQDREDYDVQEISNDYLMRSAILKSYLNGENVSISALRAFQESSTKFPKDIAQADTDKLAQQEAQGYRDMASEVDLNNDPEAVIDTMSSLAELSEEAEQQRDIDFASIGLSVSPAVKEEMVKRLSVKSKIAREQAKVLNDMSLLDWSRNILGIVLPGKQLKDNFDISGSIWSGEKWAEGFVDRWQSLTAEEQEEQLPVLKEMLSEDLPELRVSQMLGALTKSNPAEAIEEFNKFWAAFDTAEIALGGYKIFSSIAKVSRAARVASVMAKNGNKKEAAELITTAVKSGAADTVSEVLGFDPTSLANTSSKLSTEAVDTLSIDGLGHEINKRLSDFRERTDQLVESVESGDTYLREAFLTTSQRQRVDESIVGRLDSRQDIDNVSILESTDEYVRVKYDILDDNTGEVIDQGEDIFEINLDDAGAWKIDKVGLISSSFNSPTVWARHGDFREEVDVAQRLDSATASLYNKLTDLHREAASPILGKDWSLKGLSPAAREKMARVDKILLQGDREKRVFTVDELRSGQLDSGVALKDDEIETYYRVRELTDSFLRLRDIGKRREYQLRGFKALELEGQEEFIVGKPLSRIEDATNSVNQTGRNLYFDEESGELLSFSDTDLTEAYRNGKILTRLGDSQKFPGASTEVYYVLSNSSSVKALPQNIIPKRVGYVPKINQQAAYFVKQFSRRSIDGVEISANDGRASIKTVRVFDNKSDAEAFAIEQEILARERGESPDDTFFRAFGDRELEQFRAVSGSEETFGTGGSGLFTGARSDDDLLFNLDGVQMPRADAFTALSTNIASLSRYLPRNEWRMGMERKAINTANSLAAFGNQRFKNFDELANAPMDHDAGIIIRNLHRQVSDWNNAPSTSEIAFRYSVQKIIDSSIGKKLRDRGLGAALHSLKSNDPVSAARAAAFHGMLGWFNPVQLWVQAQGAAVSLSMSITNPAQFARVMQNQFALQALQHINNTPKNINHLAKALGMKTEELTDLKRAWDKSGLFDGVLTTADHAAASRGYGMAMDALKRTSDKGLAFYRAGELFNRRVAFTTGYQEWRAANKGAEITDDAIKTILDRSNNLMLNMTKAARSRYQKGLLSLPSQFMSINHRTIESLLGINGNFSLAERGKIIAGQVALYGSAGIPLGGVVAQGTASLLGYDTQEKIEKEMSDETVKLINDGLVGLSTLAMFGVDLDISDRSSLLGNIDEFVDELIFGDGTLLENLSGAFGTQGGKFWGAMFGTWEPLSLGLATNRPIDHARFVLNPLIASITTFRNVDKAYFMYRYEQLLDNNNTPMLNKRKFSLMEVLATATGVALTDVSEIYGLEKTSKFKSEYRKSVADQIVIWYRQSAVEARDGSLTEEKKEEYRQSIAGLMQTLENQRDARMVADSVRQKLKSTSNRENDAWKNYRLDFANGSVDTLVNLRSLFSNPGILKEGGFEGQEVINDGE